MGVVNPIKIVQERVTSTGKRYFHVELHSGTAYNMKYHDGIWVPYDTAHDGAYWVDCANEIIENGDFEKSKEAEELSLKERYEQDESFRKEAERNEERQRFLGACR